MSKYAAGVYSTRPADWPTSRWHSLEKIKPAFAVLEEYDGEADAETFTIVPGKSGETATLVARVAGARVCANSTDPTILRELRAGRVEGRRVRIEAAEGGVNRFWLL